MNKELAVLTAEVAALTIEFMADKEGLSLGDTLHQIATNQSAQKMFNELFCLAQKEVGAL